MPYRNEVAVDELVFANFKKMIKDKKPSDKLFDLLTVRITVTFAPYPSSTRALSLTRARV